MDEPVSVSTKPAAAHSLAGVRGGKPRYDDIGPNPNAGHERSLSHAPKEMSVKATAERLIWLEVLFGNAE